MIRLLQLCSTSDLGGAERMVLNLCEGLAKDEFEPHIGALIGSGALIEAAEEKGIPAVHLRFGYPVDPAGIMRLVKYCREHRIDIVQTHGLRADSVGRWAARMGGVRVVVSTIHSIDPWRRKPHVLVDRLTSPFVTHYVAVCQAAKQAAMARGEVTDANCSVVHIGVPEKEIPWDRRDATRGELSIGTDDYPVVGVLANLREMKGHRHIIRALPALRQRHPAIKFIFAGRDDSNGAIEQMARQAGVHDCIRFTGFVKDPAPLFAAMDIFLQASDWEGFPVSILEAMQAGVPVIATRVGGIPEMVRDGVDGLLISPGEPAAIEAAVNLLVKDFALRATLVKSADARYQGDFTLHGMVSKMSNLYGLLLEKAC